MNQDAKLGNTTGQHAPAAQPLYVYPLPPQFEQEDEISLIQHFSTIWRGKWLIIAITVIFAIGSLVYAISLPDIYRSEVRLAPAAGEEKGGLSGLAGQFGGLASLAGISLGGSGVDKTTLALEVLKSRAFISDFIRRHDLSVPLFAAKGWDKQAGEWILDEEIYDKSSNRWVRKVSAPKSPSPSDWELYEVFSGKTLNVSQDKKTSMVQLSVDSLSPVAARQWAMWLVQDLNEHMRQLDVQDASKSIEYLKQQIEKTSNAGFQQVFYQLIEQQTKTVMLAEVRSEYVLKTVDPPVVPERKVTPRRALICIVGTFLGAALGVAIVLFRQFLRK